MIISILFNIGNVLYLLAYAVRDILWLRIFTVVASMFLMPYYVFHEERVLYEPIVWTCLFVAINIYQIAVLLLERRPVFLNEQELHLYQTIFSTLKPQEFAKILALADEKKFAASDDLVHQGKPVEQLYLITSGRGKVESNGRLVSELGRGQFVGEMAFLTEEDASARVYAAIATEALAWPAARLRRLLEETPLLHVKFQTILGTDLAAKLRKGGLTSSHPSIMFSNLETDH